MRIGYARTSTVDQQAGLDAQLAELQRLGCEKLFHEQVSSIAQRPQGRRMRGQRLSIVQGPATVSVRQYR